MVSGDSPDKHLELVPGAIEDAEKYLAQQPRTLERFNRVVELIQGFETPFGLELLATVHWVATREMAEEGDLVSLAYAWGQRKRSFSPDPIALAHAVLAKHHWFV